jgi:putative membrane protein insertion efficiency factor
MDKRSPADWKPPHAPAPGPPDRRETIRPAFSVCAVLLDFGIPAILVLYAASRLSDLYQFPFGDAALSRGMAFALYAALRIKQIAVWGILLYQRFAPEAFRSSCVFEPSCSEYMLIAIQKYGLLAGIAKGAGRLLRCHYPNGGVDEP